MLSILHALGVAPDERTAAGCASFLRLSQHESGGFSMMKAYRSGIFPCSTGEHLPFLIYFGLGDDPRVQRAFAFLVEDMSTNDALDCGRYQHRDCLWGAIAALNGLAALPACLRLPQSGWVVQRLPDLLDPILACQDEQGRWPCRSISRTWPLEQRNRPSKWLTLDALRLLKTIAEKTMTLPRMVCP